MKKKIFQMLKEFFYTFEDVSSVGQQSFKKEKGVRESCLDWWAWTDKRI